MVRALFRYFVKKINEGTKLLLFSKIATKSKQNLAKNLKNFLFANPKQQKQAKIIVYRAIVSKLPVH
jgi:hypothetical protein